MSVAYPGRPPLLPGEGKANAGQHRQLVDAIVGDAVNEEYIRTIVYIGQAENSINGTVFAQLKMALERKIEAVKVGEASAVAIAGQQYPEVVITRKEVGQ